MSISPRWRKVLLAAVAGATVVVSGCQQPPAKAPKRH
jgi:hypothetical protein